MMRHGQRRQKTLEFLVRPRSNAELAEMLVDHSGSVARDMCKLRDAGLVQNLNPGKGKPAVYQLTEAGLQRLGAA